MKVGDLVKVKPALNGHFIVVGKSTKVDEYYEKCWVLCGTPDSHFPMQCADMHEDYIVVVSESR